MKVCWKNNTNNNKSHVTLIHWHVSHHMVIIIGFFYAVRNNSNPCAVPYSTTLITQSIKSRLYRNPLYIILPFFLSWQWSLSCVVGSLTLISAPSRLYFSWILNLSRSCPIMHLVAFWPWLVLTSSSSRCGFHEKLPVAVMHQKRFSFWSC